MSKIFVYFSLLALMGFVFAGTIVSVGETVEVGGTEPTPEPEAYTEPAPSPEPQDTPESMGALVLTNPEGDSATLGSEGTFGAEEAASKDKTTTSGAAAWQTTEGESSTAGCLSGFILLGLGLIAFAKRS